MRSAARLVVNGKESPREADLKIPLGQDRKLVVLCDGEAFHGPRALFRPEERMRDDLATARAYFEAGYSVVRYSESEIKAGVALEHLQRLIPQLQQSGRVCRTWAPPREVWA